MNVEIAEVKRKSVWGKDRERKKEREKVRAIGRERE